MTRIARVFGLGLIVMPALLLRLAPDHPTGRSLASDSLATWAAGLEGTWSCAGAFANGRPIAADVSFLPALSGRWLAYHHHDRAPGRYEVRALLGPATAESAAPTVLYDNSGGRRRFLTRTLGDSGVTLLRDPTDAGARLERFRFVPRAPDHLWFAWEVQRPGAAAWVIGDSLSCARQPSP